MVLSMLFVVALALACDEAMFRVLTAPPGGDVVTGSTTESGATWFGARFTKDSVHSFPAWKTVLASAETQDEWVPKRFGYEESVRIDPSYMYLRFDLAFMMNAIHVRRQLVALVRAKDTPQSYLTCWRMVDPTPWKEKVVKWATDATWQNASAGWWEAVPLPSGGTRVGYQYWTQEGSIPTTILKIGLANTLPDLLDAFDAQAGVIEGKR